MTNPYLRLVMGEDEESTAPAGVRNPYEEMLDASTKAEDQQRALALNNAFKVNPDEEAELRQLHERGKQSVMPSAPADSAIGRLQSAFPVPPSPNLIQDKAQFKTDLTMRELMSNVAFAPALKRKYTEEDFARIASDDSRQLSVVENTLKQTGDFGRSFATGLLPSTIGLSAAGLGEWLDSAAIAWRKNVLGNIPGVAGALDKLDAQEAEFWAANPSLARAVAPVAGPGAALKTYGGVGKEVATAWRPDDIGIEDQIAEGLGQIITTVALTAATGSPVPASVAFAGMGAEQQAESLRAAGLEPSERFGELSVGAAITGGSELLRLGSIMKVLPPGVRSRVLGSVVARISGQALEEGAQEIAEGLAQNLVTTTYDPTASVFEGLAEQGGIAAATAAIFQTGVELLLPGRQRAPTAEQLAAQAALQGRSAEGQLTRLQETLDAAAQSKLVKRDRAALEEFVNEAAEGTELSNVFIAPDSFAQVAGELGVDVMELARQLGVADQMQDSALTSTPITMPVGKFIATVADTDLAEPLMEVAKLNPFLPSRAEIKAAQEAGEDQFVARAEALAAAVSQDETVRVEAQAISTRIAGELNTVGRFTGDANRVYATAATQMYVQLAQRLGISPQQAFDNHPLRVAGQRIGGQPEGQVLASGRAGIVSEAQQVASQAFDEQLDNLFLETEFDYTMTAQRDDDIRDALITEYESQFDALDAINYFDAAQEAQNAFEEGRLAALDPDAPDYDAQVDAITAEGRRIFDETIEREEAAIEERRDAIQAEMDAREETEIETSEVSAREQMDAFRRQAITEAIDEFERVYGAAALLDTAYETYAEYDTRERMAVGADGQVISLRDLIARQGETLGQFAGINAATANLSELERAKRMKEQGASRDEIWQATGWNERVDGNWRFEVSDDQAALTGERSGRLEDVLQHPELYAAYPGLRDVIVEDTSSVDAASLGVAADGTLIVRVNWPRVERQDGSGLLSILHELQHGIQTIETWSGGFSPDAVTTDALKAVNKARKDLDSGAIWWTPVDVYRRVAGEVEARTTETRAGMTAEERRRTPPEDDIPRGEQIKDTNLLLAVSEQQNRVLALLTGKPAAVPLQFSADQLFDRGDETFGQTRRLRTREETLKKYGLDPKKKHTTRQVAAALEARTRAKHGNIARGDYSAEAARKIRDWVVDEVMFEVDQSKDNPEKSAVGWYSEKFQIALDRMGLAFNELVDGIEGSNLPGVQQLQSKEGARQFLTALIAVTSDGAKVKDNLRFALATYAYFRENGRLPANVGFGGERNSSMNLNLANIQALLDQYGAEGMGTYLLQTDTVSNLKKVAKTNDETFNTAYKADMQLPLAALYFGPKLGAFYANLRGDTGYLTMDRWWSRTFNRYRGTLLAKPTREGLDRFKALVTEDRKLNQPASEMTDDEALALTAEYVKTYKDKKYKNGTEIEKAANTLWKAAFEKLEDQPFNASDREFMVNTTIAAQKLLKRRGINLTVADIQAVLWYYEKRLYGTLGARQTADISYNDVARKYAEDFNSGKISYQDVLGERSDDAVPGEPREESYLNQADDENISADQIVDASEDQTIGPEETFGQDEIDGTAGTAGDGRRTEESRRLAPLEGAPNVRGNTGPDPRLVAVAEQYARDNGVPLKRQAEYVDVDPARAARIADAYDAMQHAPQDPAVQEAYANLIQQTLTQYRALEAAGYQFWFYDTTNDPYDGNPQNAMRDLRSTQSMAVFSTEAGYGSNATDLDVADNPMLADTGIEWPYGAADGPMRRVLANDLFRAVHDAFGHGLEGASFRARGEENAWQAHVRLFTGSAIAAITSETRGQNSWLNFGPYADANKTARVEDTIFADQKTGLMPEWTWTEGRAGDMEAALEQEETDGPTTARPAGRPGQVDRGRLSSPRRLPDGTAEAVHYGRVAGLTSTDPTQWGKGGAFLSRDERNRIGEAPPRTYFGFNVGQPGGYVKEEGTGDNTYYAYVPMDRLYNLAEDPDNLVERAKQILQERKVAPISALELAVQEAGYAGFWRDHPSYGMAGAVFEPVPVSTERRPDAVPPADETFGQTEITQHADGTQIRVAEDVGQITVSSAYGEVKAYTKGDAVVVTGSFVEEGRRGQGIGTDLYQALANLAFERGQVLISDRSVTDQAAGAWRALAQRGYIVLENYVPGTAPDQVGGGGASPMGMNPFVALPPGKEDMSYADAVGQLLSPAMRAAQAEMAADVNEGAKRLGPPTPRYAARGRRGEYAPRLKEIRLNASADFSTFLHELGHHFLEVYDATALTLRDKEAAGETLTDGERGVLDDTRRLLTELARQTNTEVEGDVLDWWRGKAFEDRVQMHEQFARLTEAYFMDGKAPTPEMQSMFQTFKRWMLQVYSSLTELNVELNDEVRGILDRMVAAEADIKTAEENRGLNAMFATKPAFMTDDEWRGYQQLALAATQAAEDELTARSLRDMKWLSRAKAREIRKLQNEAAEQRAIVEAAVTVEVMSQPINRARTFLRKGINPDGTEVQGPHKLSIELLKAAYPDGEWKKLGYGRYGMLGKEGIDAEMAAELFGFESGDALIRALLDAEPAEATIEGETDRRMLEEFGDLVNEEAINRAADEALHNALRGRVLSAEYAALAKASGQRKMMAAAAQQIAKQVIGKQNAAKLKPQVYIAAERSAARKAEQALRRNDLVGAATAKRDQLLNFELAREAQRVLKQRNRTLDLFRQVTSAKRDTVSKTRNYDLVQVARAILAAHGMGQVRNAPIEYLDLLKRYDPRLYTSLEATLLVAVSKQKTIADLSVDEFLGLGDLIGQLWTLSREEKQIEIEGRKVELEQITTELTDRLSTLGDTERGQIAEAATDAQKNLRSFVGLLASLRRVESWARSMDGGKVGPFTKYVFRPISEAADRYRADRNRLITKFRELFVAIEPTMGGKKIAAPELAYTFKNKAELLHAILHTGNTSNKRKLLLGRQWGAERPDGTLDDSSWQKFIARMAQDGTLTKADFDFAQGVWDLLEETKPLAQATHRKVFGRYFAEITAEPVVTPFGTYAGGYVPAIYDQFFVGDAAVRAQQEQVEANDSTMFPSPASGFTKGRVEYNEVLELNLQLLPMHIDRVLKFAHLASPVRDVLRILRDREFARGLEQVDPTAQSDMLLPWLQRASRQIVEEPSKGQAGRVADQFFRGVRNRSGMGLMFANLVNVAQQFTGFPLVLLRVKPQYVGAALARYVANPARMTKAARGASLMMVERGDNQMSAMYNAIEQIIDKKNLYGRTADWLGRHTYFMQQAVQNVMDVIVWTGGYDQALARGESEAEAARQGDAAVRETQGSVFSEDISRIETGPAWARTFTHMYSYFSMWGNLLGGEVETTMREVGLRKGAGRLMFVYMIGFLAPAITAQLVADALRGQLPEDEEDDGYLDNWLSWFFMTQAKTAIAFAPIVGQAGNAAIGAFTDAPYDDRVGGSPAISAIEGAVRTPASVYEAVLADGDKSRAVKDTLNLMTLLTGIPFQAAARPIGYAVDVAEGDIEPTSDLDYLRGLATGTASEASR